MTTRNRTWLLCATLLSSTAPALAHVPTTPPALPLATAPIDDRDTVAIRGEVSSLVAVSQDQGRVDDALALPHLQLLLKRPAARQAALEQLAADQLKPGNPAYHQWVEPAELFPAFGPAREDIQKTAAWLAAHGFHVNSVSGDGMVIDFAGTAGQVRATFRTEIHTVLHRGETHIANVSEPAIPRALAGIVAGIGLHNFFPKPLHTPIGVARQDHTTGKWQGVRGEPGPNFLSPTTPFGVFQLIGPNDFAVIYNTLPAQQGSPITGGAPLTGLGATIEVIDDSTIHPKDWSNFRKAFGFANSKGTLTLANPGGCTNPGYNGAESEADLDAEWASISAPDASVIQASCADTSTTFGVYTALQNIVTQGTPAQIISISYGFCEAGWGPTFLQQWSNASLEGASEGLSIFVSTGDGGPDTCDDHNTAQYSTSGIGANGLASNAYVTAVGGTDFYDTALGEGSTYFAAHNRPGKETALSYVPEIAWDDSCGSSVLLAYRRAQGKTTATNTVAYCNDPDGTLFHTIGAGSGAPSAVYGKPDWQTLDVYGVPNDNVRDQPDVSLFASNGFWGHGLVFCGSDQKTGGAPCDYANGTDVLSNFAGGTSFAAPAFAGIMVLETQFRGFQQGAPGPVRIGNVAPRLYQLAAQQFSTEAGLKQCDATLGNRIGTACVFNNVTVGTNDIPCLKGTPNCYTTKDSVNGFGILVTPGSTRPAYDAHPGWSFATGLGSVNVTNLLSAY